MRNIKTFIEPSGPLHNSQIKNQFNPPSLNPPQTSSTSIHPHISPHSFSPKMPPKRSAPAKRNQFASSSTPPSGASASQGLSSVYHAITAKENQPVVRSVAFFGVSFVCPFPLSTFILRGGGCGDEDCVGKRATNLGGNVRFSAGVEDSGAHVDSHSRKCAKQEGLL